MPTNKEGYMKEYYQNKKEHIKELVLKEFKCEVCDKILQGHKAKHFKTKKHIRNQLNRLIVLDSDIRNQLNRLIVLDSDIQTLEN